MGNNFTKSQLTPSSALGTSGHAGTMSISGTPAVYLQAGTTQGATQHFLISAATTNATLIKSSAGQIFGLVLSNSGAPAVFVKFYNKSTAPVPGTDVPVMTILVPAGVTVTHNVSGGFKFATGIGMAITGAMANADTTAVTANTITTGVQYA